MNNLIEENKELKRKYSQVMENSKLFKDLVDQKYISKQESTRRMSGLLTKIDKYESEIGKLQNKINEIEKENKEKIIIEKENEIYSEKEINIENKSISDDSSIKQGINLEDLLDNDNQEENDKEDNDKESIIINNNNNINTNNNNENNIKKDKKISNDSQLLKRYNKYDIDFDRKPDLFLLCPINKKAKSKKKGRYNIKLYKSPISSSSQSSKPISFMKRANAQSVYTGKIKKKDTNKNYYKIYFFLLLKSIFINNNILDFLQKKDFEYLFNECQKEEVPFNLYQEWIINKMNLNNETDNTKNDYYIDSSYVDCFICSSII